MWFYSINLALVYWTFIMTVLLRKCILSLYLTLVLELISGEASEDDKETELLDKEYGVRYASACEGEYLASVDN